MNRCSSLCVGHKLFVYKPKELGSPVSPGSPEPSMLPGAVTPIPDSPEGVSGCAGICV